MPTGILSRRCNCGRILFFVKDQETAHWLREQNEKMLTESARSGSVSTCCEGGSAGDIFICGIESVYCSRCEVQFFAPSFSAAPAYQMEFSYKPRFQSPDSLNHPLQVHPAPPALEPPGRSHHVPREMTLLNK